jgi:hypothetical protein
MGKTKVTLSVEEELLREARAYLVERHQTISGTLERALSEISSSVLYDRIATSLGGRRLEYVGYQDVPRRRPKGKDSARAVREARDARSKAVSR